MARRLLSIVTWLVLAASVSACGTTSSAAKHSPKTKPSTASATSKTAAPPASPASKRVQKVTVEMSWLPTAAEFPFALAKARGYYSAGGLDVTIVNGKGSALVAQQIAAGAYDIGQTDATTIILSRAKGSPIRAFMAEFGRSPYGVIAAKAKGIKTWRDLMGKSVGVSAGSPETYLLPATFKKLGLAYSRVHTITLNAHVKYQAYANGKVDAVGANLPTVMPLLDPKRPSVHLWFSNVLPVPYHMLFARDDYIRAHPTVIRAFARATAKALDALMADPQAAGEAAADLVKYNPNARLSAKKLVASWKLDARFVQSPLTRGKPTGWMAAREWGQTQQLLRRYGGLKRSLAVAQYYTDAYLK